MKKILLFISLFAAQFHFNPAFANDLVYQQVIQSGELRCAYALWPNTLDKDPNTKQLSGYFYDYMLALGETMQIKIVWTEEISFADVVEVVNSRRADAVCSGVWNNAIRGKFVDFTTPIAYKATKAYVRVDDTRLDHDIQILNSPNFLISVVDGEAAATIATSDFPRAKTLSLPKASDYAQVFLNVANGKADVLFVDLEVARRYIANNPGKIKEVPNKFPLRVFGEGIILRKGESSLREAINIATNQLAWTGKLENILSKHESTPSTILRPTLPFFTK